MEAETLENKIKQIENSVEKGENPLIYLKFSTESKPVRVGIHGIMGFVIKQDKNTSDNREIWYMKQQEQNNGWYQSKKGQMQYREKAPEEPEATFYLQVPLYLIKKDENLKEFLDRKDNSKVPTREGYYKIYPGDELFVGNETENFLKTDWKIKISQDYPQIS